MSRKRQRYAVVNLENNFSISVKFTVIINNNYPRISGKMRFILEDKQLIIINK
jgi:hypothetical protein